MTDGQEREASVGLDEAWEVVTRMAGGANVGPRFLSLARLVVSLGDRVHRLERQGLLSDAWHAITALRQDMHVLESTVSSITQGMEDDQSSTRTPGIGADMEQADGERTGRWRKRPVVVEATQWFKNGDHPEDAREWFHTEESGDFLGEGKVVRYFRHPNVSGAKACEHCGHTMHVHGWIDTLEGGHIVCPGDWIITGVKGERYPCKPDIFAATYEPAAALRSSAQKDGEQGDGLLEALLDSEPRYTDNPHSIGMAPVRCAYCDAKLGDRGRSYAIDDHDWDCTWVWLIGLARAPVQPSSAPVTPEERCRCDDTFCEDCYPRAPGERVERAKGCWSGGEKAQRDEQAGDSAPSNPDRIPAQPVAQEGKEADPLCQKRFSMVTAPHKISNGIVQQPCELPDGHAGECGLHGENPGTPEERVERVEGWAWWSHVEQAWQLAEDEPSSTKAKRASLLIHSATESREAPAPGLWHAAAIDAVENLAGRIAYNCGLGVSEWEGFIEEAVALVNRTSKAVHPAQPPSEPDAPTGQQDLDRAMEDKFGRAIYHGYMMPWPPSAPDPLPVSSGQDKPAAYISRDSLERLKSGRHLGSQLYGRADALEYDRSLESFVALYAAPQPSPLSWEEALEKLATTINRARRAGYADAKGASGGPPWAGDDAEASFALSALGFSHPSQPKHASHPTPKLTREDAWTVAYGALCRAHAAGFKQGTGGFPDWPGAPAEADCLLSELFPAKGDAHG